MDHSSHHSPSHHDHGHASHEHHEVEEAEAEAHHDHSNSHAMYFHGGVTEVVLFNFWRVDSIGGIIGSMVFWFVIGIAYEGIKRFRDSLLRRNASVTKDQGTKDEGTSVESPQPSMIRTLETSMWSRLHILQTALYFVQVSLSYLLMLVFMTFNTWLCLATLLGITTGYFLFGWKKTVLLQEEQGCCH